MRSCSLRSAYVVLLEAGLSAPVTAGAAGPRRSGEDISALCSHSSTTALCVTQQKYKAGVRLILKPRSLQTAPPEHWCRLGATVAPQDVWQCLETHVALSLGVLLGTPQHRGDAVQNGHGPRLRRRYLLSPHSSTPIDFVFPKQCAYKLLGGQRRPPCHVFGTLTLRNLSISFHLQVTVP